MLDKTVFLAKRKNNELRCARTFNLVTEYGVLTRHATNSLLFEYLCVIDALLTVLLTVW